MSPTENDLRAALRDGEGDGPDPGRIVALGQRARARRRTQLLNAAVITVLVGALGTGGALLARSSGSGSGGSSGDKADTAAAGAAKDPAYFSAAAGGNGGNAANGGSAAGASGPANAPNHRAPLAPVPASGAASTTGCPSAAPTLPTGGTGSGPLFDSTPVRLAVCVYAAGVASSRPESVELTGANAQSVAASLEAAPTTKPSGMCPNYRVAGERTVVITGFAVGERPVGTVTASLDRPACATVVTNGSVVRYGWRPPSELTAAVGPVAGRSHGPAAPATGPTK